MAYDSKKISLFGGVDRVAVLLYIALVMVGLVAVFSASWIEGSENFFAFSHNYIKQAVWFGISLVVGVVILLLDASIWHKIAYYLYVGVTGDKVVLHLPVEFTSYVIDTVNLDSFAEHYTATLVDGNWRITFSFMNGAEQWFAEFFLSTITGQTRLALVTPKGVMRYLGTLESGATIKKRARVKS